MRKVLEMTPCRVDRAREILTAKSNAAVYMMATRGQIPHRKFGKRLLFYEEELAAFLEGQPGVSVEQALKALKA